jgi:Flp pilus assembly protein TadD
MRLLCTAGFWQPLAGARGSQRTGIQTTDNKESLERAFSAKFGPEAWPVLSLFDRATGPVGRSVLTLLCLAVVGAYAQSFEVCRECHQDIADSYGRTGMARSFAPARDIVPGTYRHEPSGESFSVLRRDGKFWLRREQPGFDGMPSNVVEKSIEYQFGSGNHARSYFGRDAQEGLIELPLTWYSENGGHWGMSPGYEAAQHAGFTRKINERCFFCHNTDSGETARGIGCERCHGPGAAHVAAIRQGKGLLAARQAIVNPSGLTPQRQREVCLQCHLETTNLTLPGELPVYGREVFSYRAGEPLTDYALYFDHAPGKGYDEKFEFSSAPYRLFQSACYRNSQDAITCTTCHNPHKPEQDRARSIAACKTCHADKRDHHPGEDCVACHMADRRPSDAIHVTITDHSIRRVPDRDASNAPVAERNSANLPPYRGPVLPYYPPTIPADSDRQLYLAVAQVRNQANLIQGIADLEKAIARSHPKRAEFYLDLADAYRHGGFLAKAAVAYGDAIARDPKEWRASHGLGLALASSGDLPASATALERALELAPGETVVYESLALVQTRQGKVRDAVATLRAGLKIAPDSPDLANSLGTALLRAGNPADAEVAVRDAVRLRPELAAMHVNLATLLARRNAFAEARFEYSRALQLDPASSATHSAYATSLAAHGDRNEARSHFEEALRLNPALPNTHNNLGIVLGQLGDRTGAIREFRAAIALEPGFATAHFNLGDSLAGLGQLEEAERELSLSIRYAPDYRDAKIKLDEVRKQRQKLN